jgi:hypothetical protein
MTGWWQGGSNLAWITLPVTTIQHFNGVTTRFEERAWQAGGQAVIKQHYDQL